MSKKEIIIKILKELYDNGKLLTLQELNINEELYSEVLMIMAESRMIMNYKENKRMDGNLMFGTDVKITINGMEYLENKTRVNYNEAILEELREISKALNTIIFNNQYK